MELSARTLTGKRFNRETMLYIIATGLMYIIHPCPYDEERAIWCYACSVFEPLMFAAIFQNFLIRLVDE